MSNKEAALQYLARGWSVFPLLNKCTPRVKWKPLQETLPTPEQVSEWWDQWPDAWIGIALGPISNLCRLDVDGAAGLTQLTELGGPIDVITTSTLAFSSPSGGLGWLFKHKSYITTDLLWSGEGEHEEVRIQAKGAYTAIPPSDGYAWANDREPAEVPDWIRSIIAGRLVEINCEKSLSPTLKRLDKAEVEVALRYIPPDDYDTWVKVGIAIKASDFPVETWIEWSKPSAKYKDGECEAKWETFDVRPEGVTNRTIAWLARQYGWVALNKHEDLTHIGCANVLARMAHGRVMRSPVMHKWMAWDGKRWLTGYDAEGFLVEIQKSSVQYRKDKAITKIEPLRRPNQTTEEKDTVKKTENFLKALNAVSTGNSLREIRYLTRSDPLIVMDYAVLNKKPMLLNCWNGTLDLGTGVLKPHEPSDMLTQVCPTIYDPDATCPRWEQFLREVFLDQELIHWIHKLLGYCLTGTVDAHILPILWGTGRNGKSTLVKTVFHTLGNDYSGTTPSQFLATHKNETHDTKFYELFGKRFVVEMETGEDTHLNEELMKRLTGGDQIKVRRMREDYWHFDPTHKLFLATNYEPTVKGTDDAVWGRLLKIPFRVSFLGREEPNLDATLAAEAPGILAWLIRGCTIWQREGLKPYPSLVQSATAEYRDEQDTLQKFFNERLIIDRTADTPKAAVIAAYHVWCFNGRVRQVSGKAFGMALQKWFVKTAQNGPLESTNKVYKAIKLNQ